MSFIFVVDFFIEKEMDAGETMVEVMRPTTTTTTTLGNTSNAAGETHEGIKQYYVQKIEELQVNHTEKARKNYVEDLFSSVWRKRVRIYDDFKRNVMN